MIWVTLRRAGFVATWGDSACWTGWEFLTVLGEWKMALVEVDRVKMAVVCRSSGTVVHLE